MEQENKLIKLLEELERQIKERCLEKPNDYNDGLIDGLIIATRMIRQR